MDYFCLYLHIQFQIQDQQRVLEKKVDGTLGVEKLNWRPETNLVDGIQTTVNWYINKYE